MVRKNHKNRPLRKRNNAITLLQIHFIQENTKALSDVLSITPQPHLNPRFVIARHQIAIVLPERFKDRASDICNAVHQRGVLGFPRSCFFIRIGVDLPQEMSALLMRNIYCSKRNLLFLIPFMANIEQANT